MASSYEWLVWDYTLIISALVNSLLFFLAVPYKRRGLKISAIVIVIIQVWFFIDYTIIWHVMDNIYSDMLRYILNFSLFSFLATIAGYAIYRVRSITSDRYNKEQCFYVTRAPKDFLGLIGSIFKSPEGLSFVIVEGFEYRFSKGRIVKRPHSPSDCYTYRCVDDITNTEIDQIRNLKWSLFRNNCFTVFKGYDRKPRSS
jgi:hypothetical protein